MGKNADMNDVVLKVEHLTKYYPIKKGVFSESDACVHGAGRTSPLTVHRGETFGHRGRVRLRKVHHWHSASCA